MTSHCSALVIFGITGDLARKKLFSSLYELAVLGELNMPVVGIGRSAWSTEKLREVAAQSIDSQTLGRSSDDSTAQKETLASLDYIQGAYDSASLYEALASKLADHEHVLCYLAVPPEAFGAIVEGLGNSQLCSKARILLEKPFGNNRQSATELYDLVLRYFTDDQLFAVDHYLQKESLQNLLVLRFANRVFESLWNRSNIEKIEITMAEKTDVEGRGAFFDATGTLRDVIQNHGLQLLTALAMESPKSSSPAQIDASRLELLRAVQTLSRADMVFGQYDGYQNVEGVEPGSTTDTFVRAKFRIDSERWRGVEWSVMAGKALNESKTEIVVTLKPAADPSFIGETCTPEVNQITITLAPVESVEFTIQARSNALSMGTALTHLSSATNYRPDQHLDAYGRVFDSARRNDHSGFASREVVDESWRIIDDVLGSTTKPRPYGKGSPGQSI
jgi:glucose-6-phosphate 1-dehydrogenase